MKTISSIFLKGLLLCFCLFLSDPCMAKPDAGAQYSISRQENPLDEKEVLILPYAFPSDSMGTTGWVMFAHPL